jgi:hypothetical protein
VIECLHEEFSASVGVKRLTDEQGRVRNFVAEVTVRCVQCLQPFHFVGLEAGLSFTRPMVNVGATTLHAPIAPGEGPALGGFRIELQRQES